MIRSAKPTEPQQQHSRNLHRVILCSAKPWRGLESSESCRPLYLTALGHQRSIFKSIQPPLRTDEADSYTLMLRTKVQTASN